MKKINIAYWIVTILIGGFLLFSGITNALATQASVQLINHDMGFPDYMTRFLGVAKILGSITILIPAFPRLKEWAYAGLFFDMLGAGYAFAAMGASFLELLPMAGFIALLLVSYALHIKRLKAGKA
ncbi:MAG TPA: DoxX family protein [Chitinophagaceae bacterium]|nr:DoxX family protein [Chitinophagaceae bacterium]